MRAALATLLAAAFAVVLSACDPTTHRPTFTPRPEAATTELELAVPAATHALALALEGDSVPLSRVVPRDGFVETPWLDAATLRPATGRPVGPSVVRLRGWVDPSRYGFSRLTVEVVYRTTVDPSLPVRETEAEVPWSSPARARVRALLGKLGGTPVDQPEIRVARAPARKVADTTHVEGERLPLPSPVSVDSGALLRGRHDSVASRAPAAAPNQGQRAAAPPAIVPAPVSRRARVSHSGVIRPGAIRPGASRRSAPAGLALRRADRGRTHPGGGRPDRGHIRGSRFSGKGGHEQRVVQGVGGRLSDHRGSRFRPAGNPGSPGRRAVRDQGVAPSHSARRDNPGPTPRAGPGPAARPCRAPPAASS